MFRELMGSILGMILVMPAPGRYVRAAGNPQSRPTDVTRAVAAAPDQGVGPTATDKVSLHPKLPRPVPDAEITAAIERGVAFLLKNQNADGSWGSPERTKNLNIAAGIGSHHAFRTAVTALCVSALIEVTCPQSTVSNR